MGSRSENINRVEGKCKTRILTDNASLTVISASLSMTTRLLRANKDSRQGDPGLKARTSMVDGFPYKEEVGGSNPSVPTKLQYLRSRSSVG
jgi:hypothetical protein